MFIRQVYELYTSNLYQYIKLVTDERAKTALLLQLLIQCLLKTKFTPNEHDQTAIAQQESLCAQAKT